MVALLIAAFILYLYTPHLLFKFAAATKFDFITRKDLPQVEEFFAAGLPSLFLNGVTFAVLWLAYRAIGAAPIVVDRAIASAAFTKEPDLSAYFAQASLGPLLCYVGALAFVSWWSGRLYGGIIRNVALAGGEWGYIEAADRLSWPPWKAEEDRRLLPAWIRMAVLLWRVVLLLYRQCWRIFYTHYEQPLFPEVIRNSYAFVHTKQGLYHGILFQLHKKRDGDIDGITLVAVSRFSRKKEHECFRLGVNPISDLTGPLLIKWDEVLDINYPPGGHVLQEKREFYQRQLQRYAAKSRRQGRVARYAEFQRTRSRRTKKSSSPPRQRKR